MAIPAPSTVAQQICTDLGIDTTKPNGMQALTDWTSICTRIINAIKAADVSVNLAGGTGQATGVTAGSDHGGLSGTVPGTVS